MRTRVVITPYLVLMLKLTQSFNNIVKLDPFTSIGWFIHNTSSYFYMGIEVHKISLNLGMKMSFKIWFKLVRLFFKYAFMDGGRKKNLSQFYSKTTSCEFVKNNISKFFAFICNGLSKVFLTWSLRSSNISCFWGFQSGITEPITSLSAFNFIKRFLCFYLR